MPFVERLRALASVQDDSTGTEFTRGILKSGKNLSAKPAAFEPGFNRHIAHLRLSRRVEMDPPNGYGRSSRIPQRKVPALVLLMVTFAAWRLLPWRAKHPPSKVIIPLPLVRLDWGPEFQLGNVRIWHVVHNIRQYMSYKVDASR